MELKVWVEGIQRIVCGVTDKTTCQVRQQKKIFFNFESVLSYLFKEQGYEESRKYCKN